VGAPGYLRVPVGSGGCCQELSQERASGVAPAAGSLREVLAVRGRSLCPRCAARAQLGGGHGDDPPVAGVLPSRPWCVKSPLCLSAAALSLAVYLSTLLKWSYNSVNQSGVFRLFYV
jgi:hypothetical protein